MAETANLSQGYLRQLATAPAPAPAAPPAARFVGDFGEDPLSPVDEEDASDRSRKLRRLSRPGSGL